nr:probable WRKY transcription factor 70 [Ziziphus jujuba var. spinosa]
MEISSWPENLTTIQKKVNDELLEGRELAKQLQTVLASSGGSRSAEDLLMKIVKSFSTTLSILNVKESDSDFVISQIQPDLTCLDARKSQDHSRESFWRSTTTPPTKKLDRRGCYDRRRTGVSSIRDTPTLFDDGQQWRKYGQKVIRNAKYLRYDQGCKATKQIQRTQENPPLYRTTYIGHHTCKNLHQDPELILLDYSTSPSENSIFISFESTNLAIKQDPFPFLSSFSSTKQEFKEDQIIKCDDNLQNQSASSDNYFMLPDLASSCPSPGSLELLSSNLKFDVGDHVILDRTMDYDDFYLDIFQFEC